MMEVLTNAELDQNAGWNWGTIAVGAGLLVGVAALTVATGGLGDVAVGVIFSAASTQTEIFAASTAIVGAAAAGATIGTGMVQH